MTLNGSNSPPELLGCPWAIRQDELRYHEWARRGLLRPIDLHGPALRRAVRTGGRAPHRRLAASFWDDFLTILRSLALWS
jgi:hypothetical protein